MAQRTGILSLFRRDFRFKLFIEGTIIGIFVGILIVAFRLVLEKAEEFRAYLYTVLRMQNIGASILLFVGLVIIGIILACIVAKLPMSAGSGIPQVKGVLVGQFKVENPVSLILGKLGGGILGIGAGLSLGREGPSIQLGATLGQIISRRLKCVKIEEKYLITCGASAGLAAVFNAPLAGVIFALEELHKNFSPLVLISAMAASLSADVVTQIFFGQGPIFSFQNLPVFPLPYLVYLAGLGIICGLSGALFNKSLLKSLNLYGKFKLPKVLHPVVPLLIAGILGFVLPEVLGGGNNLVNALDEKNYAITFVLILLIAKFIFTMLSYGSGVPGGIFLPLLVIGSLTGNLYGQLLAHNLPGNLAFINNYTVYAMAAYFAAIVKAPVTGSILITEMTGSFHHLLPLIFVSMAAYIVADILKSEPVYELLYERAAGQQKSGISGNGAGERVIHEIVVCLGCQIVDKKVKDISWPKGCLLVGIKRGESEIIPKGNTLLKAGDYLFALVQEENKEIYEELMRLTDDRKS